MFALRVTVSASELQEKKFFDYIAERSDAICCVEHVADAGCNRTHCHLYVSGCKVTTEAIGNRLTSLGIEKGNSGRSFKTTYNKDDPRPVDKGFITYMSKGIFEPKYLKGITQEEYNTLKSLWIDRKAKNEVKQETKLSNKQKTDFEIFQEIEKELEKPYECSCYHCNGITVPYGQTKLPTKPIYWEANDSHCNTQHCMRLIIDTRRKYRKMTNKRQMESYLYMLTNNRDINEYSVNQMNKFLFS